MKMVKMYATARSSTLPNVAMPMIHVIPMTTSREMEPLSQYLCEVCRGKEDADTTGDLQAFLRPIPRTVGHVTGPPSHMQCTDLHIYTVPHALSMH